eukprot:TRINITY_DN252_c0_g1_i2.p1 TRINITY_DN252_c0_g1~~TRINITY_DN252_c0_g1_i2.p1  ORF type:complete len:237 (+),score=96.61 TRINITY_DN252_c0_g1_i2:83-712(+)
MADAAPAPDAAPASQEAPEEKSQGPRPLKLILLGDSAVGKTKLVERFLEGQYCPQHESTHALTWYRHDWEGKDGKKIPIDLWDTAGQERFNKMHASYYDGAHSAILCFDIQRKPTYKNLQNWFSELRQMRPDIPVVVAANKVDLDPSVKEKTFAFPSKNDLELFYVSAADGTNVVDLFEQAIQNAIDYRSSGQMDIVQECHELLRGSVE